MNFSHLCASFISNTREINIICNRKYPFLSCFYCEYENSKQQSSQQNNLKRF